MPSPISGVVGITMSRKRQAIVVRAAGCAEQREDRGEQRQRDQRERRASPPP